MDAAHGDRCPHPSPFPAGFDGCGTYQVQLFVPLTSGNRPLPAVRSCQFLSLGEADAGRFYPRCRLGTAADREEWLASVDRGRLERLKRFRLAMSRATAGQAERMWALKGRQLAARAGTDLDAERRATEALAEAASAYEAQLDQFLTEHAAELAELEMELADVRRLVHELLDDMVIRRGASGGPVPVSRDVLSRFPPEVQAIFAPYDAAPSTSLANAAE